MRRLFILLGVTLFPLVGWSQVNQSKELLLKKARESVKSDLQRHLDNFSFSGMMDFPQFSEVTTSKGELKLEEGFTSKIQFLDESGHPIYYMPYNTNAAITTGADHLQPGGSLGLNLTGKGFTVGIFDQTRPKPDHVEFGSRLTQIDGSSEDLSTHATHVSGTVMGGGANAQARGMAYEATGWSFNWDADISKMNANAFDLETKPNGMLISNHSYGIVLGWRTSGGNWTWFGNANVDPDRDWRFGFYSSKSQAIDELLFSKPYYSVVWAAGNDRNDTGDGTRPPDGPDDTIGPEGVAKNNITVGAVERVLDYKSPVDVEMSVFSAWGPVDDGRIKPDLVGMGVGVFSASINSNQNDSYASQSGTSMAAPNVTGSLFLLQQLHTDRNSGRFMLSSTLKALAIHTAKEAGAAPGPDYRFGWGLLDVEKAAEIIINEDGDSKVIRESILGQGETFEYEFISDGVNPIRATIAWTDPAGTPPGQASDPEDLMLVNDLDLRIFDEDGKEFFPWSLNPAQGSSARAVQNSDNFRDNVEQVWIPSPEPKKYRIRVSHKGELRFGVQQFALVFTAGTQGGADKTLYWIGGESGDWNNPQNWSTSQNGTPVDIIPNAGTRVVFDGNEGGSVQVSINTSTSVFSLNLFGNQVVELDFNGNQIEVSNGFRINNQITEIKNATINFNNDSGNEQLIEFGSSILTSSSLNFNSGVWRVISAAELGNVTINQSRVDFDIPLVRVSGLELNSQADFGGAVQGMTFKNDVFISPSASVKEGVEFRFEGESGEFRNSLESSGIKLVVESGNLLFSGEKLGLLSISNAEAELTVANFEVEQLKIGPDGTLLLGDNQEFRITETIELTGESNKPAAIKADSKSNIVHNIYRKYCFEQIEVSNVDLIGDAIINLGTNASIVNGEGWLSQNCADVLFADFGFDYLCAGAAVEFSNKSEGDINSFNWDFGGLGNSSEQNPIFVFENPGTYEVTLIISNESNSVEFQQLLEIGENSISKPNVVANGNTLTSQQPASSFQWYLNGQPIDGATGRSLEATDDGIYQVAIFEGSCNRISDPVVISAIPDQEADLGRFGIFVGPVPSEDNLNVTINNEYRGPVQIVMLDMAGRVLRTIDSSKNSDELEIELTLPSNKGLYLMQIKTNNLTINKKVIKQ